MIAKPPRSKARKAREPLDVHLTVRINFGDTPADAINVIDDRRVPMVDSVFANRDRIVRGFVTLLLKTSVKQASVVRELVPALRLLRLRRS